MTGQPSGRASQRTRKWPRQVLLTGHTRWGRMAGGPGGRGPGCLDRAGQSPRPGAVSPCVSLSGGLGGLRAKGREHSEPCRGLGAGKHEIHWRGPFLRPDLGETTCPRSALPSSQTNTGSQDSALASGLGAKVTGLEGRVREAAGQGARWRPAPEPLCTLGESVRGCVEHRATGHRAAGLPH